MSSPSSTRNDNRPMGAPAPDPAGESADGDADRSTLDWLATSVRENRLAGPLEFVGFWAAVALPFLYVPLLVETRLQTSAEAATFLALLALNVVALVVGHSYKRD